MLKLDVVKKVMPKSHWPMLSQEYLDRVVASASSLEIAEQFKENFITYANVLSKGRYKMEEYINAVKYISFKLLGYSNIKAYASTFPERYQRMVDGGQAQIEAYVSMYNRGKLVTQIYEQTIVPTWVLNHPMHQEALTELARMVTSEEVRGMTKVKALETILQYTKQPDVVKGELSISVEQSDTINDLREITENLAEMHKKMLDGNHMSLKEVSEAKIIDVKVDEDE